MKQEYEDLIRIANGQPGHCREVLEELRSQVDEARAKYAAAARAYWGSVQTGYAMAYGEYSKLLKAGVRCKADLLEAQKEAEAARPETLGHREEQIMALCKEADEIAEKFAEAKSRVVKGDEDLYAVLLEAKQALDQATEADTKARQKIAGELSAQIEELRTLQKAAVNGLPYQVEITPEIWFSRLEKLQGEKRTVGSIVEHSMKQAAADRQRHQEAETQKNSSQKWIQRIGRRKK